MARKPAEQTVSREDILFAAAKVLQEKGYHRAKMEDIAKVVNLTAGSLYHHFPGGKQEILLAVLNYGLDMISEQIQAILDAEISWAAKLEKAVELHVTGVTSNVSVGAAMVFEIRTMLDVPAVREVYLHRRDRFEHLFRNIIQSGIEHGEFAALDVRLFVRTMLGAQNWVGVWFRDDGPLSGQQIAHQMSEWFLAPLTLTKIVKPDDSS